MTKEQLIIENAKLQKIVDQQEHLASAVDAKDEEIRAMKKELKKFKEDLEKEFEMKKSELDSKNSDQINQEKEKIRKEGVLEAEKHRRVVEDLENKFRSTAQYVEHLRMLIDKYRAAYVGLMKNIQGALDTSIDLNSFLEKEIK